VRGWVSSPQAPQPAKFPATYVTGHSLVLVVRLELSAVFSKLCGFFFSFADDPYLLLVCLVTLRRTCASSRSHVHCHSYRSLNRIVRQVKHNVDVAVDTPVVGLSNARPPAHATDALYPLSRLICVPLCPVASPTHVTLSRAFMGSRHTWAQGKHVRTGSNGNTRRKPSAQDSSAQCGLHVAGLTSAGTWRNLVVVILILRKSDTVTSM
jgi:hypothetical protein